MELYQGSYQRHLNRPEAQLGRHWPEVSGLLELDSVTLLNLLIECGSPEAVASRAEAAGALMRRSGRGRLTEAKVRQVLTGAATTVGLACPEPERRYQRSGWSRYTLTSADKRKATVGICVHCRNWRGQRRRHGRQTLVYAFRGIQPKTTRWIFQIHRDRFGIETGYRQLGEACIKTTTRNPTLRLLFVGIALLLRNVRVRVHRVYSATPRRGGRKLNLHKLRFKTLLMWLTHLAEETFGIDDRVVAERVP